MGIYKYIIPLLIVSAFTACEKCRHVDPSIGDSKIELTFVDSAQVNVFDNQFDINTVELFYANEDPVNIELDFDTKSISFYFDQGTGNGQQYTDDYIVKFDSIEMQLLTIKYERIESGKCGGWRYNYVYLLHDGVQYDRMEDSDPVEIEI